MRVARGMKNVERKQEARQEEEQNHNASEKRTLLEVAV